MQVLTVFPFFYLLDEAIWSVFLLIIALLLITSLLKLWLRIPLVKNDDDSMDCDQLVSIVTFLMLKCYEGVCSMYAYNTLGV